IHLRQIRPVYTWVPVIGIALHSSGSAFLGGHFGFETGDDATLLADIREVNLVLTDIGANPNGPPGNGGFDPRDDLEVMRDPLPQFAVEFAVGRDYAFNGAWVFKDSNLNGVFDAPQPTNNGVTFTDFPLSPGGPSPRWEYVPFPPGGGDPWWKVQMQFFGGDRRNSDDDISDTIVVEAFVEPVPVDIEGNLGDQGGSGTTGVDFEIGIERSNYFVVVRSDSGRNDVSLVPGDGVGMLPGADFRAFIEPRRINPATGDNVGGIFVDSMSPPEDQWQNDIRWGATEPWWPQRTLNQSIAKPVRFGVEVHDLVMTYHSPAEKVAFADIPYLDFDAAKWLDPFGLISGQFLNGDEIFVTFLPVSFTLDVFGTPIHFSDGLSGASHQAFETTPFLLPGIDDTINGPRSEFFPAQLTLPSLPEYDTWPAAIGQSEYPHVTDWALSDRQARLLKQRVDARGPLTPMLGINIVGTGDAVIQAAGPPQTLDRLTVAVWGPDFAPTDLRTLDAEGDTLESGATLWADSTNLTLDGSFLNSPAIDFVTDPGALLDSIVSLRNLSWASFPEPIDLNGDGRADDMDGDGDADSDDFAWVLTLTPQTPIVLPPNDQDIGTPGNTRGMDLFFVVRTSDTIARSEQFRAVIPASLPGRAEGSRVAGMAITPLGLVSAGGLEKRNPEEGQVHDFYSHDMMEANIPVRITSLATLTTEIAPNGPALPALGIDLSTNRPEDLLVQGVNGTGGEADFVDTTAAWTPDAFANQWLVDGAHVSFRITGNSATRLTLQAGTPASGAYYIVSNPSFLESMVVEVARSATTSTFSFFNDMLPLHADQSVSGVAVYRDNDFNPTNSNGVFDPGVDIPLTLDDAPALLGSPGDPITRVQFVFSSPGTDDWPAPLAEQPLLRQWVPTAFGAVPSDPFSGPDFFVVVRGSENLDEGDDFRVGVVSWGPATPTEPDPDTFTSPGPPQQSPGEAQKFREFAFATRGLGFVTFLDGPATRYGLRGMTAFSEPEPDVVDWIRTSTSKKVQSSVIEARLPVVTPITLVIESVSESLLPYIITDGEPVVLVIRGENFGTRPIVTIGGFDVEVLNATNESIQVAVSNKPNVTPAEPVVIIVRNPNSGQEASKEGLLSLSNVSPDAVQVLDVSPRRGRDTVFPVMVRGSNFSAVDRVEVFFGGTLMPVLSVNEDGTQIEVGFPTGGLTNTGENDVMVRNLGPDSQTLGEDTLVGGFDFIDGPLGPCFIATAAYGTPLASEIDALRIFRDGVLLESAAGALFVDAYYTASPAIADAVAVSPVAASVVRALIAAVLLLLESPAAASIIVIAAAGVFAAASARRRRRKEGTAE
ncbi:MAG: CFI-box-CTERM domain-containing protein, partial [Candidatus Hydrogenedentota bacterium]